MLAQSDRFTILIKVTSISIQVFTISIPNELDLHNSLGRKRKEKKPQQAWQSQIKFNLNIFLKYKNSSVHWNIFSPTPKANKLYHHEQI